MTHTYSILNVSAATFADVCKRLENSGALRDYLIEDDGDRLIVFGGVALRAEAEENGDRQDACPTVELFPVTVYEKVCPTAREILERSPWKRLPGAACNIDYEILGILMGFSIVFTARQNMIDEMTIGQAVAEMKNLILLCGGKVKEREKVNLQEGASV